MLFAVCDLSLSRYLCARVPETMGQTGYLMGICYALDGHVKSFKTLPGYYTIQYDLTD